jgi:hypothetical protein
VASLSWLAAFEAGVAGLAVGTGVVLCNLVLFFVPRQDLDGVRKVLFPVCCLFEEDRKPSYLNQTVHLANIKSAKSLPTRGKMLKIKELDEGSISLTTPNCFPLSVDSN